MRVISITKPASLDPPLKPIAHNFLLLQRLRRLQLRTNSKSNKEIVNANSKQMCAVHNCSAVFGASRDHDPWIPHQRNDHCTAWKLHQEQTDTWVTWIYHVPQRYHLKCITSFNIQKRFGACETKIKTKFKTAMVPARNLEGTLRWQDSVLLFDCSEVPHGCFGNPQRLIAHKRNFDQRLDSLLCPIRERKLF